MSCVVLSQPSEQWIKTENPFYKIKERNFTQEKIKQTFNDS